MAYQFSDPFLRENGVSVLQAPLDPTGGLLRRGEISPPPPEDVRVLAEVLQDYILRLRSGKDSLRTGLSWSELVDNNVGIDVQGVRELVEELICLRPKEAAYLVGVLRQVAAQGNPEALADQDGLQAAVRSLLQPLASHGSSMAAVSNEGRITASFGGPQARIARQYAEDLYKSKHPENGNLSYGPDLGSQVVIDGMLETQVTPEMLTTRRTELSRNTVMAQSFYDGMCELEAGEGVPDGVRSFMGLWKILKTENHGGGPSSLLAAIMARNHQIGFAISILGVSVSVQLPWVDQLSRKILEAMTEAWSYQRRQAYGIYTTSRVDGNLLKNFINRVRQRTTVFGHYDCVIVIYRHTDKFLCLFDYDNISHNIMFMSHGHCELTTDQLEELPEGRVYNCYRGPDGEVKTGKELDSCGMKKSKRHKFLPFIKRSTRAGEALKGTMIPRLLSLPGIAAQLGREPEDLGCWRHMISGHPPSRDDLETFLDVSKIEVLALLSLWYEFPNHFQLSSEPVTNESALPSLTTALGHVEFAVPSNANSELKYGAVPRPLGTDSALVTVVAHQNHECWKRRILWAGPLGRNTPFWTNEQNYVNSCQPTRL